MNISIRDVTTHDAKGLAHVFVTANDDAFRGRVPDKCVDFPESESAANWQKFLDENKGAPETDVFVVAENSDKEIIGYAWGAPNSKDEIYDGELRQIMILPEYQGQGIGRQLVSHIAKRLAEKGHHSMRVEVLKVNPKREFYPHLGAEFVCEFPYDWDGFTLTSYAYGWADTKGLYN